MRTVWRALATARLKPSNMGRLLRDSTGTGLVNIGIRIKIPRNNRRIMKIYIDYDDCLCETARSFTEIAERLFGIVLPYEEVRFFNLQDSFKLNDDEYEKLMTEGHRPEILLSYEETPGAVRTINNWIDKGHEIFIITGRPFSAFDASRRWLDEHHDARN